MILYSRFSNLFIPHCNKINEIRLINSSKCFNDILIEFKIKDSYVKAFLTNNNFIRSYSSEVDCELINDRIILPNKKSALIRVKNKVVIKPINNIIEELIHLEHFNFSKLNFFHHKEIIQGYDFVKDF